MPDEIAAWRRRLPPGTAYGITAALRQTLQAAVDWRYISTNPAKDAGPNPQPKRTEIEPFTLAEIDRLAVELGPWGPFPIVAAETGLRPAELAGLEWRDLQPARRRSSSSSGHTPTASSSHTAKRPAPDGASRSQPGRSTRSTRCPAGSTRPPCSPRRAPSASTLHNFRAREWAPALDAAGIRRRRIYDLRHTFATHALAAGLGLFELSRYMGTSIELIDKTYGHLAKGAEDRARALLEGYVSNRSGQELTANTKEPLPTKTTKHLYMQDVSSERETGLEPATLSLEG